MSATTLWAAVVTSYEANGLIQLTNLRNPAASSIDTTAGEDAAQQVIDFWPIYAQSALDETDSAQVQVAKMAVIAVLWRRGGSALSIAKVEWEEVFGDGGLISKVKRTGARAHAVPQTNSGVSTKSELAHGRSVRGWSDRDAMPHGILPSRLIADD